MEQFTAGLRLSPRSGQFLQGGFYIWSLDINTQSQVIDRAVRKACLAILHCIKARWIAFGDRKSMFVDCKSIGGMNEVLQF